MHGIKIPQQDFALKMQGGLMRKGGRICGTLQYMNAIKQFVDWLLTKHRRHAHYLPSMFSCCISLVLPSLARCQVNSSYGACH